MVKRTHRRHAAESSLASGSAAPARRDPITRLSRFSEILALGLVAASFFLPFPNDLNHPRPHAIHISFDVLPGGLSRIAIIATHTRATWATLAIIGTFVAVMGYRHRYAARPHRLVIAGTMAMLLVIGCHAAAEGYLQSRGTLKIEVRSAAPEGLNDALAHLSATTISTTQPAFHAESITRLAISEGTAEQWQLLFAGDVLFSAPIFFTWFLRFVVSRLPAKTP